MTTTALSVPQPDETARQALCDRLVAAAVDTLEMFGVYLGRRLGLYATLHAAGPLTTAGLASAAGIAERYAREWLEQQAVAGFLAVDDAALPADQRRYTLPPGHAAVLVHEEDLAHVAPFAEMLVGVAGALPDVVAAYRTGAGVPYERYGADFRRGQGGINRPLLASELTGHWLPAIADLHARLGEPTARIADVGCGVGWSTIALARAYRHADVHGFDLDAGSIDEAVANAVRAGVTVGFARKDAAAVAADGPFDLVLVFEALHDMGRPAEVLRALRAGLVPGGSVLIVDERVAERFTAPGDLVERLMYGWSISHCLPAGLADAPSCGVGTVLRSDAVRAFGLEAGFVHTDELPIPNDLFRFYRLQN